MKLTREEIERVAVLARLRLTPEEQASLTEDLDPLRDDRVTNQPNADALLANAPARDATFFKVPKIIE